MGYQQLTPSSGREDENVPRPWTDPDSALAGCFDSPRLGGGDPYLRSEWGVRAGESDPSRMLCAVLLLVVAIVVLGLVWWLV